MRIGKAAASFFFKPMGRLGFLLGMVWPFLIGYGFVFLLSGEVFPFHRHFWAIFIWVFFTYQLFFLVPLFFLQMKRLRSAGGSLPFAAAVSLASMGLVYIPITPLPGEWFLPYIALWLIVLTLLPVKKFSLAGNPASVSTVRHPDLVTSESITKESTHDQPRHHL